MIDPCPHCGCPGEIYDGHVCQDVKLTKFAERAMDILSYCAFSDNDLSMRYQFIRAIVEEEPRFGVEFRFIGALGFGGKFHLHSTAFRWPSLPESMLDYRCYVSCYPEDKTPEHEEMIEHTNKKLSALADEYAEVFQNL